MPKENTNKTRKNSRSKIKLSWIIGLLVVILVLIVAVAFFETKEKRDKYTDDVKYHPPQPEVKIENVGNTKEIRPAFQIPLASFELRAGLLKHLLAEKLKEEYKLGIDLGISLYKSGHKSHAFLEMAIVIENMVIENYKQFYEIEKDSRYSKILRAAYKQKFLTEDDKNRLFKINALRIMKVHKAGQIFDNLLAEEYLEKCLVVIEKLSNGFDNSQLAA